MKHAAKFFVFAGSALLLTIVASSRSTVNTHVTALKAAQTLTIPIRADGGSPVPPFPTGRLLAPPRLTLSADGGSPVPPFPTGSLLAPPQLTLSADGGSPVPPFPTGRLLGKREANSIL